MLQRDLHAQLATELRALHERVGTLARGLDPEQLVRRPTPPGWSVGEVLEHLCVSDEVYSRPLTVLIHRAHVDAGAAARDWTPSLFGKLMVRILEHPRPVKAPKAMRPGPTPRNGIVEQFLTRNHRMLHRMDESATLDWRELRMHVPSLPGYLPVSLNLGDVFRIHVVHVRRHLGQMERVAAGMH